MLFVLQSDDVAVMPNDGIIYWLRGSCQIYYRREIGELASNVIKAEV